MSSSTLLSELQASLAGKYLFYGTCTLVLYDHLITLDQEIAYFWSEKWSISSILYIASRYLADIEVLLIVATYTGNLGFVPPKICERLQIAVYTVGALEMLVNQAVICLRVWYLFAHNKLIRVVVGIVYVVCMTAIVTFLFLSLGLTPVSGQSCGNLAHINYFSRVYASSIFLHSVLYIFTVCRTVGNASWRGLKSFAGRFVAEGGPMYLVATCALLYALIGTSMTNYPQAYIPAAESYFPSSMVAIAVCHAILSVRTLAARLDVDPTWLLSHSELSRTRWKRGPAGEIVVNCGSEDLELAQL